MRKITGWMIVFLLILAAGGLWAGAVELGVPEGISVYKALSQMASADAMGGTVTAVLPGGQRFSGTWGYRSWRGLPFLTLQAEGYTVYYYDGNLLLDNGKGYDLSCWTESVSLPKQSDLWLLLFAGISSRTSGKTTTYHLDLEQVGHPELAISLATESGIVQALTVASEAGWRVELNPAPEMQPEIPVEIQMASGTDYPSVRVLEPLLYGCAALAERETLSAEVVFSADCGLVQMEETGQLVCSGGEITLFRDGKQEKTFETLNFSPKTLSLGLGWLLGYAGIPTETGYSVELGPEVAQTLFQEVLPELEGLAPVFSGGTLYVTVLEKRISELSLIFSGSVDFFSISVPLELKAVFLLTNP